MKTERRKITSVIASDIEWDTDGEDVPSLPSMVSINEIDLMHDAFEHIENLDGAEIADRVVEYLSDTYGFCVFGCKWNRVRCNHAIHYKSC